MNLPRLLPYRRKILRLYPLTLLPVAMYYLVLGHRWQGLGLHA